MHFRYLCDRTHSQAAVAAAAAQQRQEQLAAVGWWCMVINGLLLLHKQGLTALCSYRGYMRVRLAAYSVLQGSLMIHWAWGQLACTLYYLASWHN